LPQKEILQSKDNEDENGDYLFPEIDDSAFEETMDSAIAEIMANPSDEQELVEKAVSTESVSEAKRRGLVPQSGDWGKPKRWVRPEDADVPVDTGEKPRKKASQKDLIISPETRTAMSEIFGKDFKISDFQDMYSIGLEGFSTKIVLLGTDWDDETDWDEMNVTIIVDINADSEEQDSSGENTVSMTDEEQRILLLRPSDADYEKFRVERHNLISRLVREQDIPDFVDEDEMKGDNSSLMHRSFRRENGELIVSHDSFDIHPSFQGKGIAADINEHVEKEYEKLGVSEIRLAANADIGGYAWARQGYDFSTKNELEEMQDMFSFNIEHASLPNQGGRIFKNQEELIDQVHGFTHSWQFASWNPTDEPYGQHFGKIWMLGTHWNAVKVLEDRLWSSKQSVATKSTGYKIGKGYFAAKRNEKNTS